MHGADFLSCWSGSSADYYPADFHILNSRTRYRSRSHRIARVPELENGPMSYIGILLVSWVLMRAQVVCDGSDMGQVLI